MSHPKTFSQGSAQVFHTTRWTLVARAKGEPPEAGVALGELCEAYWMPVYRYLRREGRNDDDSRELAQEFFSRLLAGGGVENADPQKGRFRSYLLGALKNFLAKEHRAKGRQKRGGEAVIQSIDAGGSETSPGIQLPDSAFTLTDSYFDRHWAFSVMERGLAAVRISFEEAGKSNQFEVLQPWLMGDGEGFSRANAASELGISDGAVKVAIHRLRQKFGEAIRREIAETVTTEEEIKGELRYLIEALQSR